MIRAAFLRRMAAVALAGLLFEVRVPEVETRTFTPICWVGDVGYETLADAMEVVGVGDTIVLGPAPRQPWGGLSQSTFPRHFPA